MRFNDVKLFRKWKAIEKHLVTSPNYNEYTGILCIHTASHTVYVAKNSDKMRLKSHLDWVHYRAKELALAIDLDMVDAYYEIMFKDPQSDPNQWRDSDFEMMLKSFYATRAGRAELL